ncbi:MBL fold metallo-hydrolase [Rhodonellum sp.]|uniref:MBL fold metallo-hydrolase n=1 Tax=Rhodonellum sp. TaxID=2231180 RepID=UPI00272413CF|nr:MBL fold metallo-hydrolase [Rhodonellum sp.]MDO9553156.1 MBL fold metallo-hydrolase [Rhodonellum sp.]
MAKTHIIDLCFLDTQEAIASFLIETSDGPILIETGPESTFPQLQKGIEQLGFQLQDIKNVFLTHIHFDHAGAAWQFSKLGAKIHLHPLGLPHLASPEKLWESAARIYGKDMDRLWGKMEPIPEALLVPVDHLEIIHIGDVSLKALHTPGHAVHHIAWKLDGDIFTGDVAGVKINNGPVVPPCPPPDIHIENWKHSIQFILKNQPMRLFLTHYGIVENPEEHLEALEDILDTWSGWMKPYFEKGIPQEEIISEFMKYTKSELEAKGVDAKTIQVYEYANPSWMSVAGLMRYWKLKSQGRI